MFHMVAIRELTIPMEPIIETEHAVQIAVYELCIAVHGAYYPSEGGF